MYLYIIPSVGDTSREEQAPSRQKQVQFLKIHVSKQSGRIRTCSRPPHWIDREYQWHCSNICETFAGRGAGRCNIQVVFTDPLLKDLTDLAKFLITSLKVDIK